VLTISGCTTAILAASRYGSVVRGKDVGSQVRVRYPTRGQEGTAGDC
jgi:hypothetical protein